MSWKHNSYLNSWETWDTDDIAELRAALDEDMANCPSCTPGNIVRHATSSIQDVRNSPVLKSTKPRGYTYHCRSWSRWFNPKTRKMEGSAHCTCDGCF